MLPGWFTDLRGSIFNDLNGDGIRQDGEPGIPDFMLGERTRGNSLQDQGQTTRSHQRRGRLRPERGLPARPVPDPEAYNPRYKNTGFTYTTDNDLPDGSCSAHGRVGTGRHRLHPGHRPVGATSTGVFRPTAPARLLVGRRRIPAPKNENGGIVGTVTYDVTRNEFDPAFSAQEDYQPGVSGISMQLWKTHKDANGDPITYGSPIAAVQQWGSRTAVGECLRADTEPWHQRSAPTRPGLQAVRLLRDGELAAPVGCTALDVNGNQLAGEMALPDAPGPQRPGRSTTRTTDVPGLTPAGR